MSVEPGTGIALDKRGRRAPRMTLTKIEPVLSREGAVAEFNKLVEGCWCLDDPDRQIERDKFVEARMAGGWYQPSRIKDPFGRRREVVTGRDVGAIEREVRDDIADLIEDGEPVHETLDEREKRLRMERGRAHTAKLEAEEAASGYANRRKHYEETMFDDDENAPGYYDPFN